MRFRRQLTIARDLTITGPVPGSARALRISGAWDTRGYVGRLFEITAGVTTMSALTIQNGRDESGYGGGGVLVDSGATLNLSDCALRGNRSGYRSYEGNGGAVFVAGGAVLNMTNCKLDNNIGNFGGAIHVDYGYDCDCPGTATLSNCTLRHNVAEAVGGGINNSGTLTLANSTLSGNSGLGTEGGGLYNDGTATVTNCTIDYNRADDGGGIFNFELLTVTDSRIHHNRGGGFTGGINNLAGPATLINCRLDHNRGIYGGFSDYDTATLINCRLDHNQGDDAGGLISGGTTTLSGCTLDHNRGGSNGAILRYGDSSLVLSNCTLAHNRAIGAPGFPPMCGGIQNLAAVASLTNCTLADDVPREIVDSFGGTATLTNTIVAGNGALANCNELVTSGGHNLSSDASCFNDSTDRINTDPFLALLANYGGPTETMALCTGPGTPDPSCTGTSPAIDAGDDSVTSPPDNLTTDQRGLPRISGAHVDIGAYEVQQ